MLLGTPFYMSPEQVSGREDLDHLADIWSVGVCMYEALTGELPFQGSNFGQVFAAILQADPPQMKASVPQELEAIVRRCLAKRPEDRPQDCGELAEALRAYGGTDAGKYPAPATSSGRFHVVRPDEVAASVAPTLAEEDGAATGFDDQTVNLRRQGLGAATYLLIGVVAAIGLTIVLAVWLSQSEVESPSVGGDREPVIETEPAPSPDPTSAGVTAAAAPEPEPEAIEEPPAALEEETGATAETGAMRSMRRGRRGRMGARGDRTEQSAMGTPMSGIIDQL